MNQDFSEPLLVCPHCGAGQAAHRKQCWLCHASFVRQEPPIRAEVVAERQRRTSSGLQQRPLYVASEWFFAIATLLLGVMLVLVGIGCAMESRGHGIAFVIVVAPPFAAALLRLQLQKERKGKVSWSERFLTFFVSAALMLSLLALLVVAALVALFLYCMYAFSGGGFH